MQGLIKSGVIAALTQAPRRIGFHRKNCREWPNIFFLNHRSSYFGTQNHVVEKNLSLLQLLGISQFHYQFPIIIPEEAESYANQFFQNHPELEAKPLIAINPGVGFKTKRWDLKRFAQLADRVIEKLGCHILLTWGPNEKDQIDTIAEAMTQPYWKAPPTTIFQSLAIYRRLKLFIGCDTGPLHLCASLGVPTVSIFGPTDPIRNGAYGPDHRVIFKKLSCSFCYKRSCPTQNECMDLVQIEEVFDAVKKSIYNSGKEIPSSASTE